MTLTLYYLPVCPSCRSVLMLARQLGLDLELKPVDLSKKEHMRPEYLAMNPAHTVPVLVDDDTDLTLFESRAILKYLVDKCAPGDSMYPEDIKTRALIDKWLFFTCGTLIPSARPMYKPILMGETPDADASKGLHENLKIVEQMIGDTSFLIGDKLTIADLDLLIGLDFAVGLAHLDLSPYAKLSAWYTRVTSLPYYEEISGQKIRALKQQKAEEKKARDAAAAQ